MLDEPPGRRRPVRGPWAVMRRALLLLPVLGACGDGPTGPDGRVVEGVDLEVVFAAPTLREVERVQVEEWGARSPAADGVREELSQEFSLGPSPGSLRVYSHLVDGHRHYGAVATPDGAAPGSSPVVVYGHGGDGGLDVDELSLVAAALGEVADDFVYVAPSFRSEPLVVGATTFVSEVPASPWDRDVDDALALLDVALRETPAADPERIGALGFSRGAGVVLLMAIRDPRIDRVVEFFGPTDFFDGWIQEIVADALRGRLRDLPGLAVLNERFIQPLERGAVSVEEFRLEIVRRSAVLFADRLPPVQVHHGSADTVVSVSQGERLIDALEALGRGPPEDGYHIYPEGGHNPLTLSGSVSRTVSFLSRLLEPAPGSHARAPSERASDPSSGSSPACRAPPWEPPGTRPAPRSSP